MNIYTTLDQLLGLLEQQSGHYRSLLVFMEHEKNAALSSDLNALNEVGVEKEKILVECQDLEEKRLQLVTDLAKSLGYAGGELNLKMISQLVAEPYAGRFRRTSTELLTVLSQLQEANQRNKQLFMHSLDLLRGSFNLLSELQASNTIYYRTGNIQNCKSTGKCVCSNI
ncbi:MAG: flagellar protein FlgN [Deltaproteobacteria bacterium]|nr:flagellar protein FlgN [Deltaproteobacteria bacterium]